jgi:cellulose synthase/poly-beta-1,6-N-acetylglucosamine synthase-like glycosyltransferase
MNNIVHLFFQLFTYGFLIYSLLLLLFYVLIVIYSINEIKHYVSKSSFTDYNLLASSEYAPTISIIAPAYNEGATIIENVRSLLAVHYNNFELILVNDGSKDDTLEKLIIAYKLVKVPFLVNEKIKTKSIRGIYKSTNSIYHKLLVVDKENGGKADALNTGINISSNKYIVCIDVDCILEQDAMLKLIKPFLEETQFRVIATGGVIRIANSCEIRNGNLAKVHLPKKLLPRMQTLEYIRAFLLGRMAWSRMNGLLIISGAFGAFDREIAIKAGGYNSATVGEDMELIVRMRRYMHEHKLPYKVSYIPDPLCWTEAPSTFQILGRQRNRWTRGTIETLQIHKKMFFNPRFGILGILSYPYWFFFELLAPVIEFSGFIFLAVFALAGMIKWPSFILLLGLVLSFGFLYSIFAILIEVTTFNQYKKRTDILKLILIAFAEPIIFHPFVVWSAVRGNIDFFRKKKSWGEMTRQGFNAQKQVQSSLQ